MQTPFFDQVSGNDITRAICWTLVHSCWQGLLLAVFGGLVVMLTKSQRPLLRYNLLSGLFLLFVMSACITFVIELLQPKATTTLSTLAITSATNETGISFSKHLNHTLLPVFENFMNGLSSYFDKYAAIIVAIWFIIFITRFIKIISGLTYIERIRHQKTREPIDYWKNRIQELKIILNIKKPVLLMESGLIQVPLAIGWLKPVILVPLGLLTHLPSEQLEAILLHELAHIKRKDYFVNLAQSFAEIIFFFNPAVLWISSLIREERENSCDDLAIAITKNKTKFVQALVTFQEYNNAAKYAMSFPGRKNQLLNRVKRIIHNSNTSLDSIEKAFILSCCFFIGLLTIIVPSSSGNNSLTKIKQLSSTSFHQSEVDTQYIKPPAGKGSSIRKNLYQKRLPVITN